MAWTAIETLIDGFHRRLCPLYSFDESERPFLRGSAVPCEIGGTRFLISAAHVCSGRDGSAVPLFTVGARPEPWSLTMLRGSWEVRPGEVEIDVAILGLPADSSADLESHYQVVTLPETAVPVVNPTSTAYLIAGYPESRNRVMVRGQKYMLPAKATCIVTPHAGTVGSEFGADKADAHHFVLRLPNVLMPRAGGGVFGVPTASGMSGGGVWRLQVDSARRLVGEPRLVGIGIEYHRKRATFVAVRIESVIALAHDLISLMRAEHRTNL